MTNFEPSCQTNQTCLNAGEKASISFLKEIHNKINKIKLDTNGNKKYSLISILFLCFIENKKNILTKKEIYDFVKNEVVNNPNKIVSTFKFMNQEKDFITENNYCSKLYHVLFKNKIVNKIFPTLNKDKNQVQYELNFDFINKRKYILYRYMFGEEIQKKGKKKTRRLKFNKSLSILKSNKTGHFNNRTNEKKSTKYDIKTNNNFEVDSSMISIKESEIKMKKSEEPSILNSSLIDSIKLEPKKIDFIDVNISAPKSIINSKRSDNSNVSSNDNSLIMPLFSDVVFNEKNSKYAGNNESGCSNSLKKINNIINSGEEFLCLLKNSQLFNLLNSNNDYKKLGTAILNIKNNNYPYNLLKEASDKYTDFCKYLDFFLYDRKSKNDLIDGDENIQLIKIKSSLIISEIITKLSQFLLDYNYYVEIIEDIFEYEHNFILKEMIKIINYDRNIISKNNIDSLEKLLKFELENAIFSRD